MKVTAGTRFAIAEAKVAEVNARPSKYRF